MAALEEPVDGAAAGTSTGTAPAAETAERAFRAAYREHLPEIWRFVRRRTGGPDDADDATAEVFAVAWRRRSDLPPGDEVRLWLFGVARRVLANQHRSVRRRERLRVRAAAAVSTAPEAAPGPGDADDGSALWTALATLDEADRELLLLRSWDGLAVTDLAVLLGCTPNAASLRLHKARGRLAAALAAVADAGAGAGEQTDPGGSRTSDRRPRNPEGGAR